MRLKHSLALMPAILLLSSCVQPVRRNTTDRAAPISSPNAGGPADVVGSEKLDPLPQPNAVKKRVWVLDFVMSAEADKELKDIKIPETVKRALVKRMQQPEASAFFPVANDDSVLREIDFDSSTHPLDVAKAARGSGISGFIRANIDTLKIEKKRVGEGIIQTNDYEFIMGISYQLIDSGTGKELARGAIRKRSSERRSDMFGGVSGKLSDPKGQTERMADALAVTMLNEMNRVSTKLGWSGRVLKLEGARLYLNAGRSSGIRLGDVLKIIEAPRDIYDPKAGDYIGQAPGRVKGTLKVIQYFGLDGAIGILQSGGGILPGDRIELL
jgi:hypothetical protein